MSAAMRPALAGRLAVALLAAAIATTAFAGGPLYTFDNANRIPYSWNMASWPNGKVPVYTDLGTLGVLSNARAGQMVQFATQQWSNVPTSSFRNAVVGDFSLLGLGDIDGNFIESVIGTDNGGGIDVVYDSDGSILTNFFGVDPTGVLGITNIEYVATNGPEIHEAWMVLSGPGIHANDPNGVGFQGVVTHEMGHALNLAHSQSNGAAQNLNVQDQPQASGCPAPWIDFPDASLVETMYPISTPEPGESGEFMGTVDRLDDMSGLSNIYPAAGFPASRGTIQGTIRDASGNPVTSVNVIARNVNDPFNDCNSYISGQVSKGEAGPDGSYILNDLTPGARYVLYVDQLEVGAFSVPTILVLPGPEEYYNGAMEGGDASSDDRCSWTTVEAQAGAPVTADITFGKYAGAPTLMMAPAVTTPTDISADGSIVVGGFGDHEPVFRWDLNTGAFDNIDGEFVSSAGISDDGSKIAANYVAGDGISYPSIYQNGAWTPLPPVAGAVPCTDGFGTTYGSAFDISGDGSTVVGLSYGSLGCAPDTIRGFKWTSAGGSVQLPKVNTFARGGRASAVSYDGSTIVGFDEASTGFRRGVVWRNGTASLILTPTLNWAGEAIDVTRDGATAIGVSAAATSNQAYRYNVATHAITQLGNFAGYTQGVASSVSNAVDVITGYSTGSGVPSPVPAIWTSQLHWFDFNTFLGAQGIATHGVFVLAANSISADGHVMAGSTYTRFGYVGFALKTPTSVTCHVPQGDPTHPVLQTVSFPQGLNAALQAGDTLGPCPCTASTPSGIPALTFGAPVSGTAPLVWSAVSGATGYDLARGSLSALRASQGNFAVSLSDCLETALNANTYADTDTPSAGNGFWYLVRPVSCGGHGTYDSGAPSQVGSRDAEIQASTAACP